jgi:hypothetical protein
MIRRRLHALAVLSVLGLAAPVPEARACLIGVELVYAFSVHPELPLDAFAEGRFPVLPPSYQCEYLVPAYRHLSGAPLDPAEQQAILERWRQKLEPSSPYWGSDAVGLWRAAREQVPGVAPLGSWLTGYKFSAAAGEAGAFMNCLDGAFAGAAETLRSRIGTYGAASAEVRGWVAAQDLVFGNCEEGEAVPEAMPAGSDPLLRADREYQIAAAHFYAGRFAEAERLFATIAGDSASPWRRLAPYLQARALIRGASLGPAAAPEALARAEALLDGVLADPGAAELHAAARRLHSLLRVRFRPAERLAELAELLATPGASQDFGQDVVDFCFAFDRLGPSGTAAAMAGSGPDLVGWLRSFRQGGLSGFELALRRWRSTRSDAWLLAALGSAPPADARLDELLEAAGKVPPGAPAFATAALQRVRALAAAGRRDEARRLADTLLANAQAELALSARNLLMRERMLLAQSLEDLLLHSTRVPLAQIESGDGREIPFDLGGEHEPPSGGPVFDSEAAQRLNALPVAELARAAALAELLHEHLRRRLAVAAWTRAVLTGHAEAALGLVPALSAMAPELAGDLRAYAAAPDATERAFAGTLLMLRFPGMQPRVSSDYGRETPLGEIDSMRDNWWCGLTFAPAAELRLLDAVYRPEPTAAPRPAPSVEAAPAWLGRRVLEWAAAHPEDPRLPEALHLVVRTTRYGCTDESTGALSKAAFQLLHRKYPKSPWTRKTPYWFGG